MMRPRVRLALHTTTPAPSSTCPRRPRWTA